MHGRKVCFFPFPYSAFLNLETLLSTYVNMQASAVCQIGFSFLMGSSDFCNTGEKTSLNKYKKRGPDAENKFPNAAVFLPTDL